jgi:hypothetical protein
MEDQVKKLKRRRWIAKRKKFLGITIPFTKEEEVKEEELKDKAPFLLLMKENKNIEVIPNVKTGRLIFDTKDGKDDINGAKTARKAILIDEKKKHELQYGEETIPVFVAYENEATCYPIDVKRDSSALYLFFQKIMLEAALLREGGAGGWFAEFFKKYGIMIVFALGALYFAYEFGWLDGIIGATQSIGTNATANMTNVTGGTSIIELPNSVGGGTLS